MQWVIIKHCMYHLSHELMWYKYILIFRFICFFFYHAEIHFYLPHNDRFHTGGTQMFTLQ